MFSSTVDGIQSPVLLTGGCATYQFSLIPSHIFFTPKTVKTTQNRLVFLHTETSFLNFQKKYTHFFSFFLFFLSFFLFFLCLSYSVWGLYICVCWGQGYENKSLALSQVMCLFSWTHLLVYCVVAFLPSYRLALAGHFSPSNPVHHILVLESVK